MRQFTLAFVPISLVGTAPVLADSESNIAALKLRDHACWATFENGAFLMRRIFLAIALTASLSVPPAFADVDTAKPTVSNPDEAIKCRKVEVTGSLVKKGKVCRTIAEWKRIQANGNRTARAIAESGNICSGGCCGNGKGCTDIQ